MASAREGSPWTFVCKVAKKPYKLQPGEWCYQCNAGPCPEGESDGSSRQKSIDITDSPDPPRNSQRVNLMAKDTEAKTERQGSIQKSRAVGDTRPHAGTLLPSNRKGSSRFEVLAERMKFSMRPWLQFYDVARSDELNKFWVGSNEDFGYTSILVNNRDIIGVEDFVQKDLIDNEPTLQGLVRKFQPTGFHIGIKPFVQSGPAKITGTFAYSQLRDVKTIRDLWLLIKGESKRRKEPLVSFFLVFECADVEEEDDADAKVLREGSKGGKNVKGLKKEMKDSPQKKSKTKSQQQGSKQGRDSGRKQKNEEKIKEECGVGIKEEEDEIEDESDTPIKLEPATDEGEGSDDLSDLPDLSNEEGIVDEEVWESHYRDKSQTATIKSSDRPSTPTESLNKRSRERVLPQSPSKPRKLTLRAPGQRKPPTK